MRWPELDLLSEEVQRAGFNLRERLTAYPEYLREPWLDEWNKTYGYRQ